MAPGARLHFLEHGLAPDPGLRRRQRRWDPWQRRLAGGCHLTRDMPALLAANGWEVERLEQLYLPGPSIGTTVDLPESGHRRGQSEALSSSRSRGTVVCSGRMPRLSAKNSRMRSMSARTSPLSSNVGPQPTVRVALST